ncbi:SDR family oxidoreductase [Arthrobacter sp. Soil736]|uniref:SDR family NAD(P)-dependent oxidoreductase n=1 Tax=Arthrobacter sp. Soil736 TaxID=1736395 RepID=UPI000AF4128A|nr:SDR family oxidoreductase [Arthrobacter sp. Soil736]
MSHFQDKAYLVTGASSGIGLATTRALLAQGARVAAVGLPDRLLDDAKRQLSGAVLFIEADVSESLQVDSAFAQAEAELGPLSGVFNAAGISRVAPIAETSDELWQRLIQVNLSGTFHFARAAARKLTSNGGGSLVCTASELSLVGQAGYTAYTATKGGVLSMIRSLAAELAPAGVPELVKVNEASVSLGG